MRFAHLLLGIAVAGLAMHAVPAHASGNLDPEFGTAGGWSAFQSGSADTKGYDAQAATDGGWYVLARTADGTEGTAVESRPMLFKTRADGTLDTAFGTSGKAYGPLLNVSGGSSSLVRGGERLYAVMSDAQYGVPTKTYVIAFDLYGRIDPGFGKQGVATIAAGAFNQHHTKAAMVGDQLVIVGAGRPSQTASDHFMIAKLRPTGQPDPTFGTGGIVLHAIADTTYNSLTDVIALTNGKLLVGGRAKAGGKYEMVVARLRADGNLDTTFGTDGYSRVSILAGNNLGRSIVVQRDGRIVVAGTACHEQTNDGQCVAGFAGFARLHGDGTLDDSFGNQGTMVVTASPPEENPDTVLFDLTIDPLDRVVAAGSSSAQTKSVLIRLDSTGQPDSTFGQQGVARFDFGTGLDGLLSVKVARVGASWRLLGVGHSPPSLVISRHFGE